MKSAKRNAIFIGALFLLFCLPSLGLADCVDFATFNRFYVQDDGSIIFYYNNLPLGKVTLQDCTANSSSDIRLIKSFICQGDDILVDGKSCTLFSVTIE